MPARLAILNLFSNQIGRRCHRVFQLPVDGQSGAYTRYSLSVWKCCSYNGFAQGRDCMRVCEVGEYVRKVRVGRCVLVGGKSRVYKRAEKCLGIN